jgi:hypothetical protein
MHDPSRSSRYPDRIEDMQVTSSILWAGNERYPASAILVGCGRCPVSPWRARPGYARYYVAGGTFPVGLLSLRLLTMDVLSQAEPLGGLHRASLVPFRGSFFTPRVHPLGATPQRLIAYLYRLWDFPSIPSPRFVAHAHIALLSLPFVALPRRASVI